MSELFYVISQPGLEEELRKEIEEVWPYLLEIDARPNATQPNFIHQELGGWLIEAPLILGLQLNHFSHLASRILLRIDEFKTRDFPKLYDKLKKIPVDSYFSKQDFRIEVAAAKSRLNNEKRILELAQKAWPTNKGEAVAAIMIRMHDDICTVSIDTTGEHLHKREARGLNKWIGEAPIRETLAAFCIKKLIGETSLANLKHITIWDPMAGAGTLIKEAANIHQGHFDRDYSFQKFAVTPKLLKLEAMKQNYPLFLDPFKNYWASDKDEKMLEILRRNLSSLKNAKIFSEDIFNPSKEASEGQLWIIANPPYGERIKFAEGFQKLGEAMAAKKPARIGIILPKGALVEFSKGLKSKGNLSLQSQSFFKNGGISVEFAVFSLFAPNS